MPVAVNGLLNLFGRAFLIAIFLLSALGNKIPEFSETANMMQSVGIPMPKLMLVGAILFLIVGSISILIGYYARFGALLLFIFLILATYYFHAFWKYPEAEQQMQMIHFMKNMGLGGAMLMIMANGPGIWSIDECLSGKCPSKIDTEEQS